MKLKNILSKGLIAGVVLATTMVVSAVSAFADPTVKTYYFIGTSTETNTDKFFTHNTLNTSIPLTDKQITFDQESDEYTIAKCVKFDSNGYITFETQGSATVEVIGSLSSGKTAGVISVYSGAYEKSRKDDPVSDILEYSDGANITTVKTNKINLSNSGKYTLQKKSGDESRLYGIKVVDTIPEGSLNYTVTGSISGLAANTEFKIGDFDAKVSEDGTTYTISKTSENDPFSDAGVLTASYTDEYEVSYANSATGVSFAKSSETAYTGTTITFTRKALGNITAGTYNSNWSRPNFDVTTSENEAIIGGNTSTKFDKGTKLSFKTSGAALINFTTKDGGNSSSKDSTVSYTLLDENNNKIAKSTVFSAANEQTQNFFVPKAGTYTFQIDEDSKTTCYFRKMVIDYVNSTNVTNGILASDGTDMYVIAKIPSTTNLANYENINLGGSTSETIYKAVKIGTTTYGNDGNYYYAVKVSPASVANAGDNITNFMYKLTSVSK